MSLSPSLGSMYVFLTLCLFACFCFLSFIGSWWIPHHKAPFPSCCRGHMKVGRVSLPCFHIIRAASPAALTKGQLFCAVWAGLRDPLSCVLQTLWGKISSLTLVTPQSLVRGGKAFFPHPCQHMADWGLGVSMGVVSFVGLMSFVMSLQRP